RELDTLVGDETDTVFVGRQVPAHARVRGNAARLGHLPELQRVASNFHHEAVPIGTPKAVEPRLASRILGSRSFGGARGTREIGFPSSFAVARIAVGGTPAPRKND